MSHLQLATYSRLGLSLEDSNPLLATEKAAGDLRGEGAGGSPGGAEYVIVGLGSCVPVALARWRRCCQSVIRSFGPFSASSSLVLVPAMGLWWLLDLET